MTILLTIYFTGAVITFWTTMLTAITHRTDMHTGDAVNASLFIAVTWPVTLVFVTGLALNPWRKS